MNASFIGVAPVTRAASEDDLATAGRSAAFQLHREQSVSRWIDSVPIAPAPDAGHDGAAVRLRRMSDDFQQARHFRTCAEKYRDMWFAGRAREIDKVFAMARAGDKRFRRLPDDELATIGRVRWSQSARAHSLLNKEKRNLMWAQTHLAFAEFELRLLLTGAESRWSTEGRGDDSTATEPPRPIAS